jgi:hypothetical protein
MGNVRARRGGASPLSPFSSEAYKYDCVELQENARLWTGGGGGTGRVTTLGSSYLLKYQAFIRSDGYDTSAKGIAGRACSLAFVSPTLAGGGGRGSEAVQVLQAGPTLANPHPSPLPQAEEGTRRAAKWACRAPPFHPSSFIPHPSVPTPVTRGLQLAILFDSFHAGPCCSRAGPNLLARVLLMFLIRLSLRS